MVKKLAFIIFLIPSVCFCEDPSFVQTISPFSGLNNTDNPATLAPEKAQDLLNVELSLGGKSVFKRKGYGIAYNLSNTTSPVHGIYEFYDAVGNDVTLAFNDRKMTSTVNGGAATVIMSTGPTGATYQCIDSQGYAYCANTSRTNIIKTDGVSFSFVQNLLSTGTMVSVTPDRLVTSGFLDNPNRVDFSAAADFSSWITGVSPTSAFSFTITAPGPRITHITQAFNRIMWFKSNSFGYILQGQTASDWVVKTISPNVGTLDNTSVFHQGILYFRGNDSNIWSYDGANLIDLTRDIGGTISVSQNRTTNFWSQTDVSDWNLGSFDSLTYVDTTTVVGDIRTLFPEDFSQVRDGNNGTKRVWVANSTATILTNFSTTTLSSYVSGGQLTLTVPAGQYKSIYTANPVNNFKAGTTFYFDVANSTGGNFTAFIVSITTSVKRRHYNVFNDDEVYYFDFYGNGANIYPIRMQNHCGVSSITFSATSFPLPTSVAMYISSVNYQVKIGSTVIISGDNSCNFSPNYVYLVQGSQFTDAGTTVIDNFSVFPQTFTFRSQVKNASSLSAWDVFSANYSPNGGAQSFTIRSSTGDFSINSSTPGWATVVPGAIPSLSTGSYFQISDYFNYNTTGTTPSSLSDFSQYWFEGQAADKSYATYFKEAIWFSVTSGTGATTNNRILRLDLLNQTWLLYDIPSNGFYVKNNSLYFGGVSSGTVYKYGDVDNDNGSPINAYWESKDFFNASPFTEDDITDLSAFFKAVNNSTMTITYSVSGSSETSYFVPMQRNNAQFGTNNRNLPLGTVGNTFSIKFGNNEADQIFEMFAIQYGGKQKSWKPTR